MLIAIAIDPDAASTLSVGSFSQQVYDNMQHISQWRPKLWLAGLLGFFLTFVGLLYVQRWKWAVFYFVLAVAIAASEILLRPQNPTGFSLLSVNLVVMIACGVHAYFIARSGSFTRKRAWYSRWYGLLLIVFLIASAVFLIRSFLFEPFRQVSNSMNPTIRSGAQVIISKWGYGNYGSYGLSILKSKMSDSSRPSRGDLVVFQVPQRLELKFLKRIVGLPGDVIRYKNNRVIVNGTTITQDEVAGAEDGAFFREEIDGTSYQILFSRPEPEADTDTEYTVPDGHYFVLGDHRDQSNDSRFWGFVPEALLSGKVVFIVQ